MGDGVGDFVLVDSAQCVDKIRMLYDVAFFTPKCEIGCGRCFQRCETIDVELSGIRVSQFCKQNLSVFGLVSEDVRARTF